MLRIILTALTIVALQTNLCPADKRKASEGDDTTLQPPKRTMPAAVLLRNIIATAQITDQQKKRANDVLRGLQRDKASDEEQIDTIEALVAGFMRNAARQQDPLLAEDPALPAPVLLPPPAPRTPSPELDDEPRPAAAARADSDDNVRAPISPTVMRLVEEDITPADLHRMIDDCDDALFSRGGKDAEHAWVDKQMGNGKHLREIREILALHLQNLAEAYADGLEGEAAAPAERVATVLELPRRGATRSGWFARNKLDIKATCTVCEAQINELDFRTQVVQLPCSHVVCKACCVADFAAYPGKTTTIPGEHNEADAAVKAAIESGALDPADLETDDLARILGGSEDVEVADEDALALHGARQYKCTACGTTCAMIDEDETE